MNTATLLAQLTDPHIREPGKLAYGRIETAPYLREAVRTLLRLRQRPAAVVVTGDLTDFGRPAEYAHLARLLQPLDMPVYLLPGNHDNREQLRNGFPQHAYLHANGSGNAPIHYTAHIGGLRMLALDTSVPGQSHGALDEAQLQWLDRELTAGNDEPVIVAMHHPPFRTLIGHMDRIGLLQGADALEDIIARHRNVERIICGHVHRAVDVRFGGTIASIGPSPAHQVCLDLVPDAASAWTLEPPAFRLHALHDGKVITHLAYIGEFDGPHPFHENGKLID
jgi:3',5'-cyclic AMP phosphodiesterase CpdA